MDNFDDAVLFRQEVANLFAGFITRPSPGDLPPIDPINGGPVRMDGDGFTPMVGLEPGTMQELLPGEQVEFSAAGGRQQLPGLHAAATAGRGHGRWSAL